MRLPDVVELLAELVAIPSVNPGPREEMGPGEGEAALADFLCEFWQQAKVEWERQEVLPGRPNVVARLEAPARPTLLLETHTDTVAPAPQAAAPFTPRLHQGRLYGRGACDAKASLAAMLVATARTAAEGHLARGVIMAAAADEEYLFRGASALVASGLDAQEAVVGEPTNLAVVRCHRGAVRWRLAVRGRAAHGSTPQQGENAIYKMARVLAALQEYAAELAKHATDPLLGGPSLSVGAIRGGELPNVVPDYCEILIDRRSMPGESFGEIEADLRHFLLERLGPDFAFSLETLLQDPPLAPGANEALAQRAAAVVRAVTGTATITAAPYSSDASKFASAGLSAIVLGPGDVAQAHAAEEWVDVEQVRQATEIYYRLLTEP